MNETLKIIAVLTLFVCAFGAFWQDYEDMYRKESRGTRGTVISVWHDTGNPLSHRDTWVYTLTTPFGECSGTREHQQVFVGDILSVSKFRENCREIQ